MEVEDALHKSNLKPDRHKKCLILSVFPILAFVDEINSAK